jgi:transposase InsO family protein
MIEDRTRAKKITPRDWALFRYGLISEATRPLAGQLVAEILSRISARQHTLPDGSLRRFSASTLRSWLRTYQREGLDGLIPKSRSDKGSFRTIDDDTAEIIARHRVQNRKLSVKLFHQVVHEDGVLPEGFTICEATLRRFLKTRGLDKPVRGPGKARAKYEMPHPNELWVADFMHGPRVKTERGKRKAILCAIIDDHSRVIVGARFSFTEETADILHTLRDAIATYSCIPSPSTHLLAERSNASFARFAPDVCLASPTRISFPSAPSANASISGCARTITCAATEVSR